MMMIQSRGVLGSAAMVLMMVLICAVGSAGLAHAGLDFEVDGTKVQVGGYAKLMLTYDLDGTHTVPYNGDLHSPYSVPMDGTPQCGSGRHAHDRTREPDLPAHHHPGR